MRIEVTTKFNLSERVYHQTKESNEGFVIDISYSAINKQIKYLVAFNQNESDWYYEHELSENKTY